MAFRFVLARLLQFRQNLEHSRELRFQRAVSVAAALLRARESLDEEARNLRVQTAFKVNSGIPAAELQFDTQCLLVLQDRRREVAEEWRKAEDACLVERAALRNARQQREVVETLKRRALDAHHEKEAREE